MNEIIVIAGFSGAGKDTIAKEISRKLNYKLVISHTTRPKRQEETDGVEYHFVSNNEMCSMALNDRMIEFREYNTVQGRWFYGISKDSIVSDEKYIAVVDIDGYRALKKQFGKRVKGIFVDVGEPIRYLRASKSRKDFCSFEWHRRYQDDIEKFPESTIKAEFDLIVENYNFNDCINEITEFCNNIKQVSLEPDVSASFKNSKYLYDIDFSSYENYPYRDVLTMKIQKAKALLEKLVRVDNMQDTDRINDVNKAIEFNRNLLKEIGYSDKQISEYIKRKENYVTR